jgi:hypothetical protein
MTKAILSLFIILGFSTAASAAKHTWKAYGPAEYPTPAEAAADFKYLASLFPHGSRKVVLGTAVGQAFNSSCNSVTGCSAPVPGNFETDMIDSRTGTSVWEHHSVNPSGEVSLEVNELGYIEVKFIGLNSTGSTLRISYVLAPDKFYSCNFNSNAAIETWSYAIHAEDYFVSVSKGRIEFGASERSRSFPDYGLSKFSSTVNF